MAEFLNDLQIHGAGQIQFKTAAGTNGGKIDQNGNDLVLTNPVGDILLGDGAADIYIGDGTNSVDLLFEQSASIKADDSATGVTITLGSSNTSLILESPTVNGSSTFNGAATINNKLTFTTANGYILFDYEPSTGDNAEYTNEVPLLKVDKEGTEKVILSRLSNNGALAIGIDDTVAIVAGDTKSVIKANHNYANENIVFSSEGGFTAYGFPGNDTSWSNRNVFQFSSTSTTASSNGLFLGDGGATQFIDINRNLKNIGTISSGAITSGAITSSGKITVDQGSYNPASGALMSSVGLVVQNNDGNMELLSYDDDSTVSNNIGFGRYRQDTGALIHKFGITTWALTGNQNTNAGDKIAINYGTSNNPWSNTELFSLNTSGNATFTGNVEIGTNNLNFADNGKARFGNSTDLQIYHDGSHSIIADVGTGDLLLRGNNLRLQNSDGTDTFLHGYNNGKVELFYNSASKFETTSSGATVTGTLTATSFSGDGSNITNVTATDSSKVAKAGDTMTGNLTLNDDVQLRFGTSGAESNIKSDGSDTIMTLSSGSFLIGTNGGTPHDNSGKADFVVDINNAPQISLYSNQVQVGSTDMNWNAKWNYDGTQTNFGAWDNEIHIFTQGSSGATEKSIFIKPQGTDGTTTTRAKFMGDSGVYLYGTTTVAGDIMPSADSTYDIGSNSTKWAEGHFDHLYVGETGNNPRIDIYTENSTANIADSFADTTTDKSYIYFNAGTGSSDPGYIMHETSDSETNEGVLHLVPSDDNGTGDYVSIHGTNDPDVLKLHTSGLIETVNLQLQIKSGLNDVYINDNLQTTGNINTTADGTYNIGSNGTRFATGYFDAVAVTNTLTAGALDINGDGDVSGNLNITGNITNANWQGDVISATKGGTGLTSISTLLNSNAFANFTSTTGDYDNFTRGLQRAQGGSNGPSGGAHSTGFTLLQDDDNYGFQLFSFGSGDNTEKLFYRYKGTSYENWQTIVTKTFADNRYGKIASPTFTGTVTVPDLTVTGNLSITGDINSYNVNNLDVVDKLITVGKGQTEANSNGSGILVDGSNASLLWDETNNTWDFNKSLDVVGNINASGNITVGGTVDGRDVAADGTKLDTIDTNADVTPTWVPSSDPGYLTSSSTQSKYLRSDTADTATGKITLEGNSAAWSATTPGLTTGSLHFDPGVTTDHFGNAITFGASDSDNGTTAQAGIYLRTDGSYGSRMYFATTDAYNTGSKVAMYINNNKVVYFLGGINMSNSNISGVNAIQFNDPGPSEGLTWTNTKIFESPNDLTTNTSGNLQLVYNNTRRLTVDSGGIDVNGNIVVSGTVDGVDIANHNHDSRYYTETESDAKFTSTDGSGDDYTFKIGDESNITGNKWYHVATTNGQNGGLHIRGAMLNHVENFASQKFDLAIQVREANDGGQLEITGSLDVLHNASGGSATDKAGIRVIKTAENGTYDEFKIYIRTCRYSMVNLRLTKRGSTTFNTSHSSPLTTEPAPVSGGHVEIDTSSVGEGNYVVDDSAIKEIYHEGHLPTLAELGAQASGDYITGTGSLSAQDLTDIGNLSGTNTGDQDLSSYLQNVVEDTSPQLGGHLDMNGKYMYEVDQRNSIDLKDHSDYTWFRNAANRWIFQGGTSGDDWTQSFALRLESVGTGFNDKWAYFGQQNNNGSSGGKYKGVRIVKSTGSGSVVDGDFQAGDATFSGDVILTGTAPTLRIQDSRNLNNDEWDNVSLGNIEFYTSDTTSPGARALAEIEAFSNASAASGPNAELRFKTSTITDSSPQTRLTISHDGAATFTGNTTSQGYLQSYGILYLRNNIQLLNKAGNGWLTVASRDTSGAEAVYNLDNLGTVDGVDIAARDSVLTSTTTTANAALPKAGGTMTGSLIIDGEGSNTDVLKIMGSARIQMENANATDSFYISNTGGDNLSVLDLGGALTLIENGDATFTGNINLAGGGVTSVKSTGDIALKTSTGEYALYGTANGNTNLYYNGVQHFRTDPNGVTVTGNIAVSGTVDGRDIAADGTKLDGIASNATANAGTVTSVTAGTGMTQSGTSTVNPTLNVIGGDGITANANDIAIDYSTGNDNLINSATTGTPSNGATILFNDSGGVNKAALSSIDISHFNNNSNFTSNTGTVTAVTVGTGLDVGNGTTTPNITLDLNEITKGTGLDSTTTGLSLDFTEFAAFNSSSNTVDHIIGIDDESEETKINAGQFTYQTLTAHFSQSSGSSSTFNIPMNNTTESTTATYYHVWTPPFDGKVKTMIMKHAHGTSPSLVSSQPTKFRVAVNGTGADYTSSSFLTRVRVEGRNDDYYAYIKDDNINQSFSAGDRVYFQFLNSSSSVLWRNCSVSIVVEYNMT